MSILIFQRNVHRSHKAIDEESITKKHDIMLIQEPPTAASGASSAKVTGYQTKQAEVCNRIRSCILVRNDLQCSQSNELCNDEISTVILEGQSKNKTIVSSIYIDHDKLQVTLDLLQKIVDKSVDLQCKLVLGGDFNAWSMLWNEKKTDPGAKETLIEEFIVANGLNVCNVNDKPTYERDNSKTIIDVTLSNDPDLIKDWFVEDEHTHSDHRAITYKIE